MSAARALGALLVVLPFIVIAVGCARTMGIRDTLGVFAAATLIAGCIFAGFWLLGRGA